MYTITHRCGHVQDHYARHGYFQPETVRFLADSPCETCANKPPRYTMPNLYRPGRAIEYNDLQFMRRDALGMIAHGAPSVTITDRQTGETIVITA